MLSQTIEQGASWNEDDDGLGNCDNVRRLRLIVEHCDVTERAARPEHFQHLLAALRRGRHGTHATPENDAKPFGAVATSEDHIAGVKTTFREARRARLNRGLG